MTVAAGSAEGKEHSRYAELAPRGLPDGGAARVMRAPISSLSRSDDPAVE